VPIFARSDFAFVVDLFLLRLDFMMKAKKTVKLDGSDLAIPGPLHITAPSRKPGCVFLRSSLGY
jgi:hypothetical protein